MVGFGIVISIAITKCQNRRLDFQTKLWEPWLWTQAFCHFNIQACSNRCYFLNSSVFLIWSCLVCCFGLDFTNTVYSNLMCMSWYPSAGFFMAGINLTEDTRYVLSHLTQSMKSMTLQSYNMLMDWVKKQHPGSRKTSVNIICADFVGILRNEFCEIVIGLNIDPKRWPKREKCYTFAKRLGLCVQHIFNRSLYSWWFTK